VRKKIALLSVVSAFILALVIVPAASARYIYVTARYEATQLCRTAPDTLTYKLKFSVKIERSGVDKPKTVRIGYQVLNADSLSVLKSGVVNLKRSSGYKAKSARISVTAGQSLSYHLNMKYTVEGKTSKSKTTSGDTVPSVEAMDAAGVPNC
jgi:hypothetical protein